MAWLKFDSAPIMIGEQWNRDQPTRLSQYTKPRGFWITDDTEDNWERWCRAEDFCLERLTYVHRVTLDEGRILILRSGWEIEAFTERYAVEKWWGPDNKYCDRCIDWPRVASEHSGLIITPYQWSCRLSDTAGWYYTWDCASGCIWEAKAILNVELIEVREPPKSLYAREDEDAEAA